MRMVLHRDTSFADEPRAQTLAATDLDAVVALVASDRSSVFFRRSMLDQGTWRGIWEHGHLVACAGTHVISDRFGVAALGGVMTHPDHRGRGLAAAVTSAVCNTLMDRVDIIGLNVAETNLPAIGLYRQLGFREVLRYEEIELL